MDMIERRLLAVLCLLPPGPVPCERLERLLMPHAGRAEVRVMLNRQVDAGRIRLLRNLSGDELVCLVPECLADLHRSLFGAAPGAVKPVRQTGRATEPDLVMDMVTLFGLIADGMPKLSPNGRLAGRTGEIWSKRMTLTEEAARRMTAGKRATLSVPDNLAVVLDLLCRAGLVALRDGRILPDTSGIVGWLGSGDREMRRNAYHLWMQAFVPANPLARHAAWLLPSVPEGEWVDCPALEQSWRAGLAACGLDDGKADGWIEALEPLRDAGWLVFGETEDGTLALRPAFPLSGGENGEGAPGAVHGKSGGCGGPLYVQPDFELLLSSSGSYALHGVLEGFADLAVSGRMNVYRLTERSVKRALGRGWSAKAVLDVLASAAWGEVPDEVVRGLADWERAANRFRVEPAVLLRFSAAGTEEAFAAMDAFRPFLREDNRLSPGVYVLREKEWEAFRKAAERAGEEVPFIPSPADFGLTEPEKPGMRASGDKERAENDGAGSPPKDFRLAVARALFTPDHDLEGTEGDRFACPGDGTDEVRQAPLPGLFPSPFSFDGYRPAEKWQAGDLFPGFRELPAAWWKGRCGGHPATKRRILRQAMEWGCRVEAELGPAGERCGQPASAEARPEGAQAGQFERCGRRVPNDRQAGPRMITFLVTELAEDENGWRIEGFGEDGSVRLRLDEVDALRIVLPGLSNAGLSNNST